MVPLKKVKTMKNRKTHFCICQRTNFEFVKQFARFVHFSDLFEAWNESWCSGGGGEFSLWTSRKKWIEGLLVSPLKHSGFDQVSKLKKKKEKRFRYWNFESFI